MTIFQMIGKCLTGNTNLSALINKLLLKVKILTNELRDQKYWYDLLLFHFYSNPVLFRFIIYIYIYIYIYITYTAEYFSSLKVFFDWFPFLEGSLNDLILLFCDFYYFYLPITGKTRFGFWYTSFVLQKNSKILKNSIVCGKVKP